MKNLLFTTLLIPALAICASSCHNGNERSRKDSEKAQTDTVMTDKAWTKTEVKDLTVNPFTQFAKDWMALAVGSKKNYNSMTISWGSMGELWNKPVVIVYVSKDRYTKKLMDDNSYFTVTAFPPSKECRNALEYIGSHSQRDEADKTSNSGLTVEFTQSGNPIFSEGRLTFECKKIYSDEFEPDKMPQDILNGMYAGMGMHTMYIGEIVNVWEKK